MAVKLNQSLKQTQGLMITPQLQQAIKMLTMTHMEMANVISQEMVENPMLEEMGASASSEEISKQEAESKESSNEDFLAPDIVQGEREKFDWDKYVESFNNNSSSAPDMREGFNKDDAINYENMVSRGMSLPEHLEWQLRMESLGEDDWKIAHYIIHNINDEGYLDEKLEVIAKETSSSIEEVERVLLTIQFLDPVGCGSRNLQECLSLQAKALKQRLPLVEKIIASHLENLKSKKYDLIASSEGVSVEQVKSAEEIVVNFHPKPGRLISTEHTQYVVPDIYIREVAGEFQVVLNSEGVPNLRISNIYKQLLQAGNSAPNGAQTKEYVQEKLKAAMWLIKSIQNRKRTIYRVAESILKNQPEFFKKGAAFLKPMILKDIAQEIGVHESTVSRVTTNKYVHTPLGTFELKYFFNSSIGGKKGGIDTTSEGLKLKIKGLLAKENPKRPLSDQKLSDILKQDGIIVARRTVAKYRESLGTESSSKRKQK